MKQLKTTIITGSFLLIVFIACNDFEDVPIETFSIDYVFSPTDSVGKNAMLYLSDAYINLAEASRHSRLDGDYLDSASDDAVTSSLNENNVFNLQTGTYDALIRIDDDSNGDMRWGYYYKSIRQTNTIIKYIDRVPFNLTYNGGQPMNRAVKAEARFLRAYAYFELIKRYGGVPIVYDNVFELKDDVELPRQSFETCVDYIVDELDAIRDSLRTLPIEDANQYGAMASREAAMALKSRVLLYAASPLFNEKPIEKNNEYVGYLQYDINRWKKAADAAKYVLDNYKQIGLTDNFGNIFLSYYSANNPEVIFYWNGGNNHSIEDTHGPVGFSGSKKGNGRTSPTHNLAKAFPMADGKPINQSPKYPYTNMTMYDDRDPRFYKTILYNGARWFKSELQTYVGGFNNPDDPIQKTKTSYYMRKFMGNWEEEDNGYGDNRHVWIVHRYAEIMLNYAEALNEFSGPSQAVYDQLKAIRKRAGIEEGDDGMYGLTPGMSQKEMREAIQNEWRIEFAFEEHRYWDIRRWRIAEDIFKAPVTGLEIIWNLDQTFTFNEVSVVDTKFDTKRYLYPVPFTEVVKNKNMVQNPGW